MESLDGNAGLARLLTTVRLDSLMGVVSTLNEGLIVLDPLLTIVTMNPAAASDVLRIMCNLAYLRN